MKKINLETAVGLFVVLGIVALGYLSIRLGGLETFGKGRILYAEFEKAGGIKPGASVEIAGVEVGKVKSIRLNEDYQALLELSVKEDIEIQEDAFASIKTKGLIGEKYVMITPGGSEEIIGHSGKIRETESAVDIEELISKYVFGKI
ncbi:MAG: outer membrane lipid asymmetry maintenance protein MlaD [bacterium]|nr:outer membrane lipid asymmetry maintenance protein MlaD [bacterium]